MKHNKTINNNGGFNNAVYRGSTAAYENSYQCLVYELALGFCPYSPFSMHSCPLHLPSHLWKNLLRPLSN